MWGTQLLLTSISYFFCTSHFQMRTRRFREVKWLIQGTRVTKAQIKATKPDFQIPFQLHILPMIIQFVFFFNLGNILVGKYTWICRERPKIIFLAPTLPFSFVIFKEQFESSYKKKKKKSLATMRSKIQVSILKTYLLK